MYTLESNDAFYISQPPETYIYDILPLTDTIACISSDDCLRLLDPLSLQRSPIQTTHSLHTDITCLEALDTQNGIVCTAGRDGRAVITDIRVGTVCAQTRVVLSWSLILSGYRLPDQNTPLISLATNPSTYSIAAGTELANSQASVVIWDTRNLESPRLQYIESHSDDVTELQYHPVAASILLSGSTDGLVNIYDTNISEEEDALYQTINHGSSIHRAGFLNDLDIFALSHDEKFSIYGMITNPSENVEEPSPINFGDLRERVGCEYVVNVKSRRGGEGVVGVGTHSQETFDLVQLKNDTPWTFAPESRVTLSEAHGSDIIRSFCFLDQHKMVLTAGENGQVKSWKSE